jgi:hypothetical protein
MKHDGCLLSQQSCDTAVISVDMVGGKGEVAAAMDKVCSATDIIQATHNYTILCIFTFYVKLGKICQYQIRLSADGRLHIYCISLQKLMVVLWRWCNNTGL